MNTILDLAMKHYEIDCWEVTAPDGGGVYDEHCAYFSSKSVAEEYAQAQQAKSNWPRSVQPFKRSYTVLDSIEECEELTRQNVRNRALKKLTAQEREELGL